ncbi:Protein F23H11.5 [Aphelenchoides avenae]|nr:Protein F23H11.5 [Aphelenchus avenae]
MTGRLVLSRLGALRNARVQPRRYFNPGPPTTMDYVPVPHLPYDQVHGALQKKFNIALGAGAVTFIASLLLAYSQDVFLVSGLREVDSWRFRNQKA